MTGLWLLVPVLIVAALHRTRLLRRPDDEPDPMREYWTCPCGNPAPEPFQVCDECADYIAEDDEYRRRIDV